MVRKMKSIDFETDNLPFDSCKVICITKNGLKPLSYRKCLKEFGEMILLGSSTIWQKYEVSGWVEIEENLAHE